MSARRRPSFSSIALWLAFVAVVAAAGPILLSACGMTVGGTWNFCPAPSAALAAEVERQAALSAVAQRLQIELARHDLDCVHAAAEPTPPFELPVSPEPARPQQTAALKSLPAARWNAKDLAILQGCWQLGRATRTRISLGTRSETCTVLAGTICFGSEGGGERRQEAVCPGQRGVVCRAPVTAKFGNDGKLQTTQPRVNCEPPSIFWNSQANTLSCTRVDDAHANCLDAQGFSYEFRRKDGAG